MQLFDSPKMYVFVFCIFMLGSAAKLYLLFHGQVPTFTTGLGVNDIVHAFITIGIGVHLAGLFRKLSSRIEQAAIVIYVALCFVWLVSLSAKAGIAWVGVPHSLFLSAAGDCTITVLAAVRTFQVSFHRTPAQ
jgi:hypothetical protein